MLIPDAPDILKQIVNVKRQEVDSLKTDVPISILKDKIHEQKPPLNMAGALTGNRVRIIAEVKQASPTKGLLVKDFHADKIARTYAENGAAAISILTNSAHFQGSIDHLASVHDSVYSKDIPILRKDFIFDPYQIYESRANGADAILLIVAMLSVSQIAELKGLAEEFWMQTIIEVHDESELAVAIDSGAEIIGINNRDLRTFVTDLSVTERLASIPPSDKIIVSESGISTISDISRIQAAGVQAALIGEALITSGDIGQKLAGLV